MDERLRQAGLAPGFTGAEFAQITDAFVSGIMLGYSVDPERTDLQLAVPALRRIFGLPDEPSLPDGGATPATGEPERGSARRS